MKANELRIGNYFLWRGMCGTVNTISEKWITEQTNLGRFFYEDIEPIPLTEEWLVKFGFEQYNNTNHYFYTNTKFIVKINSDTGYLFGGIDHEPIKYVHQLQNLYFALTNEELTTELG